MSKAFHSHLYEASRPHDFRYILLKCGASLFNKEFQELFRERIKHAVKSSSNSDLDSFDEILEMFEEKIIQKSENDYAYHVKPNPDFVKAANRLDAEFLFPKDYTKQKDVLEKIQKELVLSVYKQSGYRMEYTSSICGISPKTLRKLLYQYASEK